MPRQGRKLEEIIAVIEKALAGSNAEIKSPDYIKSKNSSGEREVDISIRTKIGSSNLLICVECRDRTNTQGVEWIDSLIGKKEDIGADKIIAVSSSRFSKKAQKYAINKGLELRYLKEINENIISNWLRIDKIPGLHKSIEYLGHYAFRFPDDCNLDLSTLTISSDIQDKLKSKYHFLEKIIKNRNGFLSLAEILNPVAHFFFDKVQINNSLEGTFRVNLSQEICEIKTNYGFQKLACIDYDLKLIITEKEMQLNDIGSYSDISGNVISTYAEFSSLTNDLPIRTVLSRDETTQQISVMVLPGKLPS